MLRAPAWNGLAYIRFTLPSTTVPPPDSVPVVVRRGISDSARVVINNSRMGGAWPRGILTLLFREHTPLATRVSILEGVPACVVGGWQVGTDGAYLIALLADTSAEATVDALFRLEKVGSVEAVSVVGLGLGPAASMSPSNQRMHLSGTAVGFSRLAPPAVAR